MPARQILIADDEPNLRRVLTAQLERDGYEVRAVEDGQQALDALGEHHIDLVISDLKMPNIDGLTVLKHVNTHAPDVPVILITAHGTVDSAVEALKLGAFDYVTKPFDRTEFRNVVRKAVRTRELSYKHVAPPAERGRYRIIGNARPMQDVYRIIERVADTPSTVLVTGESGTGKELVARALHENGARLEKPFIKVNCAAIPPDLIESELFGYEKGAFTGAVTSKPGRFELADGGTLFLDEIGEVPANIQVKLLRALQEQEFERVGGIKTIGVDVRLVAATNRDLKDEIAAGRFREDLYYRLNVVHLHLPPLRGRSEDIPLLLEHFIERFNKRLSRGVLGFTEEARRALLAYPWPGNIRELENVVERCMLFCDGDRIGVEHLPEEVRAAGAAETLEPEAAGGASDASSPHPSILPAADLVDPDAGLKQTVRQATAKIEHDLIARALAQTGGNVTHAARLLKISRKGLQTKMKELGFRGEER
ncbi:MAG: sigma-54-dependent transcriptional regulator [Myxococcota bacterium]